MTSAIDVRTCALADWPGFIETMGSAFGNTMTDEGHARWERLIDRSKMLVATDQAGGRETVVGTAGWLPFDMVVPGGEIPVAAVTMVTVRPTHRRRGILRQMLRREFDDLHAAGIAVSTLWASESVIYQRFGYGLAYIKGRIEVDPRRAAFLNDPGPVGRTRLIGTDEALEILPAVYERARRDIPASFRRSPVWWEARMLADPPDSRFGGSQMFRTILEIDGRVEGYALYRLFPNWDARSLPNHALDVIEALGTSPAATREVWRFLFGVDLVSEVRTHRLNADHPLFLMLADPRRLRLSVADGTWVRLVDVAAALEARRYATEGTLTFELIDEVCPWNAGTWTLEGGPSGATLRRTTTAPELRLSAADLGAMYLGTVPATSLLRAGRIDELTPGAASCADAMFRSDVSPWCLDDF